MRLRFSGESCSLKSILKYGMREASSSKARTSFAVCASSRVKAPSPGPISRTLSFRLMFEASTIFFTIDGDFKKFCPRCFFALIIKLNLLSFSPSL